MVSNCLKNGKTWRLRINTTSISYLWGVGKQEWDIWWKKRPLLWDWSSPSWCIFQAFQVTPPNRHFWEWGVSPHEWVIHRVGVSVLWCPAMGWAASCHLPGFTWVLWISEQWWFFSLGRCCSHHPKSGLGHYLWCRKQMWCCPTLLPGVQDKTQTSQAFLLFCLNPGNSAGISLIPAG